jgi:6-phosphogluconolactonase
MIPRDRTTVGLAVGLFAASCGSDAQRASDASVASSGDAPSGAVDAGGSTERDASSVGDPSEASPGPLDAASLDGSAAARRLVAYASGYGPNIFTYAVDPATGALAPRGSVAAFGSSPSFLAHNGAMTNLYAVDENVTGRVGAYAIDGDSGALSFLGAVSSGGNGPAFVSVDGSGKFVLVANYGDGTVSVLPVGSDGRLGAASDKRTVGSEAHMIVADPSNAFVFVPCKGSDYVAQFTFDTSTGKLSPNATPRVATASGAGPRHLAFHPGGRLAYLVNETNSTLTAFALDATKGTLTEIETKTTLPAGFTGTNAAAEVWVHPSGRWVLASNRGDDSIVVFAIDPATGKMTLSGFTKAGGQTPRDFALDPTGTWLYAADEDAGAVVPFRFDPALGSLAPLGGAVSVPAATYVGLGSLPSLP